MTDTATSRLDDLPARLSGRWAEDKLYYVDRYLHGFHTAMRPKKWRALVYADLMAGPGLCRIRHTDVEMPGSPLLAAAVPFHRLVYVERDPALMAALQQRLATHAGRTAFVAGDCNDGSVIDQVRLQFEAGTLGVTFVDNLGLTVTMETLRRLNDWPVRSDLLITVMTQDLSRNLAEAVDGHPNHAPRFDAFFGTPAWRDALSMPGADVDLLGEFYVKCLSDLGYTHCRYTPTSMRNSRRGQLYRLMLASRDQAATAIFNGVCARRPSGDRALF